MTPRRSPPDGSSSCSITPWRTTSSTTGIRESTASPARVRTRDSCTVPVVIWRTPEKMVTCAKATISSTSRPTRASMARLGCCTAETVRRETQDKLGTAGGLGKARAGLGRPRVREQADLALPDGQRHPRLLTPGAGRTPAMLPSVGGRPSACGSSGTHVGSVPSLDPAVHLP